MWISAHINRKQQTGRPLLTNAIIIFFATLYITLPSLSFGQVAPATKYPSAVLVQLWAERNRTNSLIRARKYRELEIFKKDAAAVIAATTRDFKDHFNYCPVYFYMDTNFEAVKAKKYDGVLLNTDLTPATNINITPASEDYIIVYFGFPTRQHKRGRDKAEDTTLPRVTVDDPPGLALVINNDRFHQLRYISRIDGDFFNFRRKKRKNVYKYVSKKFNLAYYPTAAELNRQLDTKTKDTYIRHRKTKKKRKKQ